MSEEFKRKFGVTLEDVERMLADQDGRCAACRVELKIGGLCRDCMVVDHCHDTNQIRGLLCSSCNIAIGMARNNPERLRALADYLERGY